jgi:hypothetical protein
MQDPLATDPHFLFGAARFQEHSSLAVISSPLYIQELQSRHVQVLTYLLFLKGLATRRAVFALHFLTPNGYLQL